MSVMVVFIVFRIREVVGRSRGVAQRDPGPDAGVLRVGVRVRLQNSQTADRDVMVAPMDAIRNAVVLSQVSSCGYMPAVAAHKRCQWPIWIA